MLGKQAHLSYSNKYCFLLYVFRTRRSDIFKLEKETLQMACLLF